MNDMEERPAGKAGAPLLRGPKRTLVENPKAPPAEIDGDGSGSSRGHEGGGG